MPPVATKLLTVTTGAHLHSQLVEVFSSSRSNESKVSTPESATTSTTTTMLCKNCLEYNFSRETLAPPECHRPDGDLHVNNAAVFTTFGKLVDSSTFCPLCELILKGLESNYFAEDNIGLPLALRVGRDSEVFVSAWIEDEITISFFIISPPAVMEHPQHPITRLTESNLRIYAENEDWAHSPPLVPWSQPCLDLLKRWLDDCIILHGSKCRTSLSGEQFDESLPPVLPSRVIDVGPPDGSESARLLESNGRHGYYTALSYCWGSAQKSDRPYLTTTKTLEKHLSGLPWDLLPKTLQDAILLTRAVGMQYLWIDSLCIIQDSNADWEKEASTMGAVFSQARLVIAATTGTDAGAGLFPSQTHIHRPGQPYLHFRKLPAERGSRKRNLPLFTRGWAAQEWVLARRIVFWTHERMCWFCASACVGDNGKRIYSVLSNQRTTWEAIVKLYSWRNLTYAGDKLVAFRGIANEIQKKRPTDKYAFGSWQSNLPHDLLWSGQAAATDPGLEKLHIPSWSWAAHPGGVGFLSSYTPAQSSSSSIQEDSSLQIMARFKKVNLHEPDMDEFWFHWFRHENGEITYEKWLEPIAEDIFSIRPKDTGPGLVQVGLRVQQLWVVFDRTDFLSLFRRQRSNLGISAGIPDGFSFVEIGDRNVNFYGHAGVLLRKSHLISGKYIRVGMGVAFAGWFRDAKMGEFIVE